MERRVQLALMILAAIALPALAHAADTEALAKRAALFTPQGRAAGFRTMDTAYPYHGSSGAVQSLSFRAPRASST